MVKEKNGKFEIRDQEIGLTYWNPLTNEREDLSTVLSPTDVFYVDSCNKPILGKMASLKFFEKFELSADHIEITSAKDGVFVVVYIEMLKPDGKLLARFCGDGEASSVNLEKGISSKYPLALAVKRAKSRAIIEFFRIDAYSEVESPDFSGAPSEKQIKDIKTVAINRFLFESLKDLLKEAKVENESEYIKSKFKSIQSGMQFSEVDSPALFKEILDIHKGGIA